MKPKTSKVQLDEFQARIDYRFDDAHLLEEALTHSSAVLSGAPQYERLEFLGDRVLGLVIADLLLRRHPDAEEGVLARALNALVRKEACVEVARQIRLGELLVMDEAEARAGGREKKGMLGDACEALLGAIFLDGGFNAAQIFIAKRWSEQIEVASEVRPDAKTALQEWAHAELAVTPDYETIGQEGPDHAPTFLVEAKVGKLEPTTGTGRSKRDAEQLAAQAMLQREGVWS